ncbi:ribosomal-protein-alanine N-acetyltransferase [Actinomadura madurae]|uniref:Ribosomal-protein-alanine N-acetyltransferase n=2 Tax=Thermomonosporaceae TaxID=2012 RepID=A0A1I5T3I9_9ACTN|nr:ribosomal protein S18-alanine N-acetyltransferase [Actinomadura madurae]SFP77624.1 ribosomal-protein-alanine N-acetyltransferase [Actinomadura madurae]SPT59715.1 Protease synthase and sporulation negative regulatory protein PAI 1 [Actinomadura madurae]
MSGIVLRPMTGDDLPAVHRLDRSLFPENAWSEEMLAGELADQPRTRHYVVAADPGGEIVGYAGLAAAGGQADVQTIGVRADRRKHGIGAALLTELLDEAVRRRSESVFLEVRADNDAAHRLYERFGFTRVGVRKRYYQPSDVDAIVMCRTLRDRPPIGFTRPE